MGQDSTRLNYWAARMTIPHTKTWEETWQWTEAIRRNIYIAQYLYEENGNKSRVTLFYEAAKKVEVGDVLLLIYANHIYAYGKVVERPTSDQFRTTKNPTEYKKGIVAYTDAPALYENLDFVKERMQNPSYSNLRHTLENWELSWRQCFNVDKWHCFSGFPLADTVGLSKYAEGSCRLTLFNVNPDFCKEKNIVIE